MKNVRLEKVHFEIPETFNAKDYIDKTMGVWLSAKTKYNVKLLFSSEIGTFAAEHIWAGEHTHRGSYGHLGREFGYIIEGKAHFQYESLSYDLEAGDSISFSASSPHTLINSFDAK